MEELEEQDAGQDLIGTVSLKWYLIDMIIYWTAELQWMYLSYYENKALKKLWKIIWTLIMGTINMLSQIYDNSEIAFVIPSQSMNGNHSVMTLNPL